MNFPPKHEYVDVLFKAETITSTLWISVEVALVYVTSLQSV